MRNAGLDEAQAGIKTARRNINNIRYADDTTLMSESKEELRSLLYKVKEEWKSWLKTQHLEGEGFRMGNTYIPVADSFQYMAKPIQYCKVKKFFKKKEKKKVSPTKKKKKRLRTQVLSSAQGHVTGWLRKLPWKPRRGWTPGSHLLTMGYWTSYSCSLSFSFLSHKWVYIQGCYEG